LIERFRQLAPREQLVLGVGAALAVIIIAWAFIWTPLQTTVEDLRESVHDRSLLVVDLRRAANLSARADASGVGASAQLSLVDDTARPIGLAAAIQNTRFDDSTNTIRVTLQNASFTLIVDWLIGLDRQHGVRAGVVNLQPSNAGPGLVSGLVVLSRS
jgi:type II secretory pathway component PulM